MNELIEEHLQNLSFLDFLIYMRAYAQISIFYHSKSHDAFIIAREVMRYIIIRYIKEKNTTLENYHACDTAGENFYLDEKILDKYRYCKKDTDRRDVIVEFKRELDYDLCCLIRALERTKRWRRQQQACAEIQPD